MSSTKEQKSTKITIDATGRSLGRVASEVAVELLGKKNPHIRKNEVYNIQVEVTNASKINLSEKKGEQMTYTRYSGFPGGLKVMTANEMKDKKGYGELIRIAVRGMLPKNKLRKLRLMNLSISE